MNPTTTTKALPTPGQIVRVRMRQYLVEEVVPPPNPGDSTLVRMACVDDDAQGQPLEVLWDKEIDAEVLEAEAWADLAKRGFDPPRLFSAYMHTLRWNCVTATDPGLFQSPFRAGIELLAYQLEPLRKALRLPRVNLFIADDVGLGKTIEAGLIARELLLRKKVRDIVTAAPPSVLLQWKEEMENRFGLSFVIVDREYFAQVRRERGYAVNPWKTHTRFLISHRLLIDETYVAPLRDWLGGLRPGSLLILDEAHHAAPASGTKYAIDSKFTRAIRDIARRFEHRLFLSATPHNGHSNSFSALLEILDPQRFCRGAPVTKKNRNDVMVRRLKEDIRAVGEDFPKREVVQVDIRGLPEDQPELVLSRLLDKYRELRRSRMQGETKHKRAASDLLLTGLQQRLLSSIEAFARTLKVHKRTILRQWEEFQQKKAIEPVGAIQTDLLGLGVGADDDRANVPEEELIAEEEAQFEDATVATTGPLEGKEAKSIFKKEQDLLEEMTKVAEAARGLPDARVHRLVDWVRDNLCPGLPTLDDPDNPETPLPWKDTRLLIFTEYDDTKRYLVQQLKGAIAGTDKADDRIEVFHGPTPPAKREEIKRAFNMDPAKHPVRILVATDAAREGINLQTHCFNLFHFDVPWNPSRLEQRNGRIDRKLQPRDTVFCHYFVYEQRPEDRVLQVLVRKTKTIKEELGSLSQVVEGRLTKMMEPGISHKDVEKLMQAIEKAELKKEKRQTVEEELEEAREREEALKKQIAGLRKRVEASKQWIGFDQDHFKDAISCALEMMEADPLKPSQGKPSADKDGEFTFPALDQRDGADPSWAETLDTLRAPRKRDQKFWEWRKESPIRPVVFKDPGNMAEEVVHLHLEHRVVRRLLGRFRAQGFVHDDLSRACMTQTKDAIPRVVLLGRLCLFGPHASRLHEELISVSAQWVEPTLRRRTLKPEGRRARAKTRELLEAALLPGTAGKIPKGVEEKLRKAGPGDVEALLPHLEEQGNQQAEEVEAKLLERGQIEAKAMVNILEGQRAQIEKLLKKAEKLKDWLAGLEVETKRQMEAEARFWNRRLPEIEKEMKSEPGRVREVYNVKAWRIEPVGLVYLWPETG